MMSHFDKHAIIKTAEKLCQQQAIRFTDQRRQVLEIIAVATAPVGAYEILDQIRQIHPGAAPPTVYRALEFLQQHGLIHKLESLHAYVACNHPGDPHTSQFLICFDCGKVKELDDVGISSSVKQAATASGFQPTERLVEVTGTCEKCQTKITNEKDD
jgi:Fur family zinc uptake transcriptional regulator